MFECKQLYICALVGVLIECLHCKFYDEILLELGTHFIHFKPQISTLVTEALFPFA